MSNTHISVLLHETLELLDIKANAWYVDGTFGRGGHTREILNKGGKVIAFDCDQEAIEFGEREFAPEIAEGKLILIRENFDRLEKMIKEITAKNPEIEISGIFFDFGVSSPQIDNAERGFSFQYDAELDMRMDNRLGVKAKDLLAILPEKQLSQLFIDYGGEHEARKIAYEIVKRRSTHPLVTVRDLTDLIEKTKREPRGHLNPATKVFQALRIAVNSELDSITQVLPQAFQALPPGGRLVTISFHEGEDRIVKHQLRNWEDKNLGETLTKKAIQPSEEEIVKNTRARSAKLRGFIKK
jgi:16S rRNA (cytosine1402-N4)-methyltransferase